MRLTNLSSFLYLFHFLSVLDTFFERGAMDCAGGGFDRARKGGFGGI
jgi:hypothetical protein